MELFIGFLLILIQGFFEGSETSFTKANFFRLEDWSRRHWYFAKLALALLKNRERVLITNLVGSNLLVVLVTTLFSRYAYLHFGAGYISLVIVITVILSLIFGQFLPKAIGQAFPEIWASLSAPVLKIFITLFYPVSLLLEKIAQYFTKPFLVGEKGDALSRHDFIVALSHDWHIAGIGKRLLEMGKMVISDVLIPLSQVKAIPEDASLKEITRIMTQTGFSRYPVYKGNRTNITGFITTKDLLFLPKHRIHKPDFVKEDARAIEVLSQMREKGCHIAIVLDENNRAKGIVTLEDLIEELVGEIRSET